MGGKIYLSLLTLLSEWLQNRQPVREGASRSILKTCGWPRLNKSGSKKGECVSEERAVVNQVANGGNSC